MNGDKYCINGVNVAEMHFNDQCVYYGKDKTLPTISYTTTDGIKKISLNGIFEDSEHRYKYLDDMIPTDKRRNGFVYKNTAKLGNHNLTLNTAGRTFISITNLKVFSWYYSLTPTYPNTRYTVRALWKFKDERGMTIVQYSKPIIVSWNSLSEASQTS